MFKDYILPIIKVLSLIVASVIGVVLIIHLLSSVLIYLGLNQGSAVILSILIGEFLLVAEYIGVFIYLEKIGKQNLFSYFQFSKIKI
jgi:hypothetical protein